MDAAKRFFTPARTVVGHAPEKVTTDGHDAYPWAIRETRGPAVRHRTSRRLNDRMEQDHRGITQRYYPCAASAHSRRRAASAPPTMSDAITSASATT